MTIDGLSAFLDKNIDGHRVLIELNQFTKKRIAVDASIWAYKYIHAVMSDLVRKKKDVLEPILKSEIIAGMKKKFMDFNSTFFRYDITLIWMWDGEAHHLKHKTQAKRSQAKDKNRARFKELTKILEETHILQRPEGLVSEYNKLQITLTSPDRETLKEVRMFCEELGIPSFIGEYEAEMYAALLAVKRHVAAVWSSDFDLAAIGVPLFIKEFEINKEGIECISGIWTPKILEQFKLTQEEFRDFCIACGTDFNDNIPKIGPKRAMDMLKKYGLIENWVKVVGEDKVKILNHHDSRRLLSPIFLDFNMDELKINKTKCLEYKTDCLKTKKFINEILSLEEPECLVSKCETEKEEEKDIFD